MLGELKKAIIVAVLGAGCAIPQVYAEPAVSESVITQTLLQMESPAEDMLDAIDHKNKAKLADLYQELNASMATLNQASAAEKAGNAQSRKIGLQNAWFDLIALEMEEMDDLPALANAINQFSGQLIVSTNFKHDYQKNIAWMDYLGRELFLMNKYPTASPNHAGLLKARKAELQATWRAVRASIGSSAAGLALIKKVDPTIEQLLTESRPLKLVALSQKELDLIDNIETYFHID